MKALPMVRGWLKSLVERCQPEYLEEIVRRQSWAPSFCVRRERLEQSETMVGRKAAHLQGIEGNSSTMTPKRTDD